MGLRASVFDAVLLSSYEEEEEEEERSWPHAVGMNGELVKTWIENEHKTDYTVHVIRPGDLWDDEYIPNRVLLHVNIHDNVVMVPRSG
jgi:hypothetical protein